MFALTAHHLCKSAQHLHKSAQHLCKSAQAHRQPHKFSSAQVSQGGIGVSSKWWDGLVISEVDKLECWGPLWRSWCADGALFILLLTSDAWWGNSTLTDANNRLMYCTKWMVGLLGWWQPQFLRVLPPEPVQSAGIASILLHSICTICHSIKTHTHTVTTNNLACTRESYQRLA